MRAVAALLMLVIISPTVIAISDGQNIKIDLEINGEDIIPTYSESVQAAFARVENLNQYSQDELEITKEWLVVTQVPEKKQVWTIPSPKSIKEVSLLPNSYIWHFNDPLEAIPKLQEALVAGQIESFSPLVVSQTLQTRDNPNDPEFASQWHLENTGQTGGLSGEDINATDIWDNYRGQEVVISVVDDGLDHSHVDISPHYNSTFSYDWCNDDPDPTPNSWDEHGTAVAGVAAAVGNNS
ncbi:MAG TPA: S8 family serine peptidase, partial [Candidatus Thalassarchaeaceae archaeon]|nr:S8 family serine peptidase [Candidatus Thalassarchaeaceae archaeon]